MSNPHYCYPDYDPSSITIEQWENKTQELESGMVILPTTTSVGITPNAFNEDVSETCYAQMNHEETKHFYQYETIVGGYANCILGRVSIFFELYFIKKIEKKS
jgi:hypothetical protein